MRPLYSECVWGAGEAFWALITLVHFLWSGVLVATNTPFLPGLTMTLSSDPALPYDLWLALKKTLSSLWVSVSPSEREGIGLD